MSSKKPIKDIAKASIMASVPETIIAFGAYDALNSGIRKRKDRKEKADEQQQGYSDYKDSYSKVGSKYGSSKTFEQVDTPDQ